MGTLFIPPKTPAPGIITIFGGVNRLKQTFLNSKNIGDGRCDGGFLMQGELFRKTGQLFWQAKVLSPLLLLSLG